MKSAALAALASALLLAGCAGREVDVHFWDPDAPVLPLFGQPAEPPQEPQLVKQYVVLLPNDDGSVGEIDVADGKATVTLTEAYDAVDFDNLAQPYTADKAALGSGFAPALAHLPDPPISFTVYFLYSSPRLTAQSEADLPAMLAEITRRSAPEVRLHGHADRAGTVVDNEAMSRRRAEAIRDRIVEASVAAELVEISWHGESQPAIATEDGVREPENRRVEIHVR